MVKQKTGSGLLLGFLAVACFGFTLPMTRFAVKELDPLIIGAGRALAAAVVAGIILIYQRASWPSKKQLPSLIIIGLCISLGFPLISAYGMKYLPASHGAIILGLLPMATAYFLSLMKHEKPSPAFWIASLLGTVTVVGYAFFKSGGVIHGADLLLFVTVIAGAVGYAYGAVVARQMGGMKVMSWALVLMLPILAVIAVPQFIKLNYSAVSLPTWGAFLYLALISQLFGMALWYKALSTASASKVSQTQLLQPFLTIFYAGLLFGEHVDLFTWVAAIVVVLSIQFSRKASIELKH